MLTLIHCVGERWQLPSWTSRNHLRQLRGHFGSLFDPVLIQHWLQGRNSKPPPDGLKWHSKWKPPITSFGGVIATPENSSTRTCGWFCIVGEGRPRSGGDVGCRRTKRVRSPRAGSRYGGSPPPSGVRFWGSDAAVRGPLVVCGKGTWLDGEKGVGLF